METTGKGKAPKADAGLWTRNILAPEAHQQEGIVLCDYDTSHSEVVGAAASVEEADRLVREHYAAQDPEWDLCPESYSYHVRTRTGRYSPAAEWNL